MGKRLFVWLLTAALLFTSVDLTAFAAESGIPEEVETERDKTADDITAEAEESPVEEVEDVNVEMTGMDGSSGTLDDGLSWDFNSNGILTISGTGPMEDFGEDSQVPWKDELVLCNI